MRAWTGSDCSPLGRFQPDSGSEEDLAAAPPLAELGVKDARRCDEDEEAFGKVLARLGDDCRVGRQHWLRRQTDHPVRVIHDPRMYLLHADGAIGDLLRVPVGFDVSWNHQLR